MWSFAWAQGVVGGLETQHETLITLETAHS